MSVVATAIAEIAPLVLSVAQFIFYIQALDDYSDKLEELSDKMAEIAESDKAKYERYRSRDPYFYNYYLSLSTYSQCSSNIQRAKGRAFNKFASNLKKGTKINRGYTPLAMLAVCAASADSVTDTIALERAATHNAEAQRYNDSVLVKYSAIASAPVGTETNLAHAYEPLISNTLESVRWAGRGINSAGAMLGSSLYQVLS